ncbi:Chanoclavine-I aldehyde reductase fgaOx3 [Colletotrichum orbiculare MAFF 240422]|uniref:Chanoclavine-I aldehyde reductase fgaOx3 n=1 Tax=Colletotrichum orbiculare (strain 104-T / ATCC 96160 / CBS 514.97 / LARS 414 / MAFF 240422) TaxID=1213857 RepID=N4VD12_COLOR|nr:Chanoclavine-I aldehyde reductase fgaOx3 [Colletotrichum orbiculare MAFF 240422]
MAPMTRFRTDSDHGPLPMTKEYYSQRCHTSGTLIITEGTAVSETLVGLPRWAGFWSEDQLRKWKDIVREVHSKGCFVFLQLCCAGRTADKGFPKLSSGDVPLEARASAIEIEDDERPPEPMTEQDIQSAIDDHATAARNAVAAGFDGVELHGANGYLIDQFTQESCNNRTDAWGGSVERRSRFALEVTAAVVDAVGGHRVGFRISPWSTYHSIEPRNPEAQFTHLVAELQSFKLAYLHVVTSRVDNWYDVDRRQPLDFVFRSWRKDTPVIVTGGFDGDSARRAVDAEYGGFKVVVGFGRSFAATPDLVACIKKGIAPNPFRGDLAYTPGTPEGYIDYPFLS